MTTFDKDELLRAADQLERFVTSGTPTTIRFDELCPLLRAAHAALVEREAENSNLKNNIHTYRQDAAAERDYGEKMDALAEERLARAERAEAELAALRKEVGP